MSDLEESSGAGPCGSRSIGTPRLPDKDDCCADGGRCDHVCIQIAASYNCTHACHRADIDRDSRDLPKREAGFCASKTRITSGKSSNVINNDAIVSCEVEAKGADSFPGKYSGSRKEEHGKCKSQGRLVEENILSGADISCAEKCCSSMEKGGENTANIGKNTIKPPGTTPLDTCCDPAKESRQKICTKNVANADSASTGQEICCDDSKNDLNKPQSNDNCGQSNTCAQVDTCRNSCCGFGAKQANPNVDETCCSPDLSCTKATEGRPCIESANPPSKVPFRQACASHLQQAFEKYSSYLVTGRCICRNALSQANVCCDKELRAAAVDSGASSSVKLSTSSPIITGQQTRRRGPCAGKQSVARGAGEMDSCCPVSETKSVKSLRSKARPLAEENADLEKSAARQTVRFNIAGMTCTGCSNKALKTLNHLVGVSRAEVIFISSIGEIDLDPRVTTAEVVLRQLTRETGFKCTRIIQDEQVLDIMMSPDIAKRLQDKLPDGITSITKIGRMYQVSFDPLVIGARSVVSLTGPGELAPPRDDTSIVERKKRLWEMAWNTGLATIFTIPVLVLAWSDTPTSYSTRSIVSLVLATVVQALAIPEFYIGAVRSLVFSRVLEMDMLVVISITAAYGYSVIAFALTHAGYKLEQDEFFETSSLLITLVLFGRLISAIAKERAVSTVSLRSLQAETACLVRNSGESCDIDARLLQYGDTIMIRPHSRVVTDGIIIKGTTSVDESMITGETLPVLKGPGDSVIAGTINVSGPLTVRLTRLPGQNSISDIATLVQDAVAAKPRVQDLADKVASWFIPIVVSISIVVFIIWLVISLKVREENAGGAVGLAITYAIAVLAISCPCALGLAVPMVLVITGGVAARAGVIIKQADATERSFKVTDVIFDKTGTLTTGVLEVIRTEILPTSFSPEETNSLVCALLKDNNHPVSKAAEISLQKDHTSAIQLDKVESIPGAGIQAFWKGLTVKAGNPAWLAIEGHPKVAEIANKGMTLLCVTVGSDLLAVYGLKSRIRDEATEVISKLHRKGIVCHIVSGDGAQAVEDIARSVGIPLENLAARRSPTEKQHYVKSLMDQGRTVLFCGDGTNDAVAIAQADVGVQIGSASDITRAIADVVLLGGLECLPALLVISRRAFNRVIFNFAWSAIYNLFAILLAAGAFVKFRIPPAYAGVGELISVLPVILAALTLNYVNRF